MGGFEKGLFTTPPSSSITLDYEDHACFSLKRFTLSLMEKGTVMFLWEDDAYSLKNFFCRTTPLLSLFLS